MLFSFFHLVLYFGFLHISEAIIAYMICLENTPNNVNKEVKKAIGQTNGFNCSYKNSAKNI